LTNALVQRRDEAGADYFTNAGGTRQNGIELNTSYRYAAGFSSLLDDGKLALGYTYSHFRYKEFIKGENDFSGKTLPGVPSNTLSVLGDVYFKTGWYFTASYYGAAAVFLNDANDVAAR